MILTLLILLVDMVPTANVRSQITVPLYCTEILFYIVVSFTRNINSLWIDSMYYLLILILLLFLVLVRPLMLSEWMTRHVYNECLQWGIGWKFEIQWGKMWSQKNRREGIAYPVPVITSAELLNMDLHNSLWTRKRIIIRCKSRVKLI